LIQNIIKKFLHNKRSDSVKNKRILWLFNHTPLREFEVPMLLDLGFEVFCCKQLPGKDININSYTSVIDFDDNLTIKKDDLEKLNNFNFYDQDFSKEIKQIINANFGVVFFPIYEKTIVNVLKHLDGKLFLHVFGREYDSNYSSLVKYYLDKEFKRTMNKVKGRFWFAPAYEQITLIEDDFLKNNAAYLPIGMSKSVLQKQDTWEGGINKILFICPRIEVEKNGYYRKIYDNFKNYFGDLSYEVVGGQINKLPDRNITGFLSNKEYEKRFTKYSVMFYHSQEKRHVHYHPLEAIVYGMPLIFMGGGILSDSGGAGLPGECKDFNEARVKIERILKGDKRFAKEIIKSQKRILKRYSLEYCRDIWKMNFLKKL
jgi:hypothetical protein